LVFGPYFFAEAAAVFARWNHLWRLKFVLGEDVSIYYAFALASLLHHDCMERNRLVGKDALVELISIFIEFPFIYDPHRGGRSFPQILCSSNIINYLVLLLGGHTALREFMQVLTESPIDLRVCLIERFIAFLLRGTLHGSDWALIDHIDIIFALQAPNSWFLSRLNVFVWLIGDSGRQRDNTWALTSLGLHLIIHEWFIEIAEGISLGHPAQKRLVQLVIDISLGPYHLRDLAHVEEGLVLVHGIILHVDALLLLVVGCDASPLVYLVGEEATIIELTIVRVFKLLLGVGPLVQFLIEVIHLIWVIDRIFIKNANDIVKLLIRLVLRGLGFSNYLGNIPHSHDEEVILLLWALFTLQVLQVELTLTLTLFSTGAVRTGRNIFVRVCAHDYGTAIWRVLLRIIKWWLQYLLVKFNQVFLFILWYLLPDMSSPGSRQDRHDPISGLHALWNLLLKVKDPESQWRNLLIELISEHL
jgi:hypothetical protein